MENVKAMKAFSPSFPCFNDIYLAAKYEREQKCYSQLRMAEKYNVQ